MNRILLTSPSSSSLSERLSLDFFAGISHFLLSSVNPTLSSDGFAEKHVTFNYFPPPTPSTSQYDLFLKHCNASIKSHQLHKGKKYATTLNITSQKTTKVIPVAFFVFCLNSFADCNLFTNLNETYFSSQEKLHINNAQRKTKTL